MEDGPSGEQYERAWEDIVAHLQERSLAFRLRVRVTMWRGRLAELWNMSAAKPSRHYWENWEEPYDSSEPEETSGGRRRGLTAVGVAAIIAALGGACLMSAHGDGNQGASSSAIERVLDDPASLASLNICADDLNWQAAAEEALGKVDAARTYLGAATVAAAAQLPCVLTPGDPSVAYGDTKVFRHDVLPIPNPNPSARAAASL